MSDTMEMTPEGDALYRQQVGGQVAGAPRAGLRHVAYLGIFFAVGVLTFLLKMIRVDEIYYTVPLVVASAMYMLALFVDRKAFIFALFAFLPFAYSMLQFRAMFLTLNPFTLSILLLAIMLVPLMLMRSIRLRWDFGLFTLILLAASVIISNAGAANLTQSGLMFFHSFLIPMLSYLIIKANIQTKEDYRAFILAMAIGSTIFAVVYIVMFIGSTDRGEVMGVPPIGAAGMLFPIVVYLFSFKDLGGRLRLLLLGTNLTALLFTLSRAFMITLLLVKPLLSAVRRGWGMRLLAAILAISLAWTIGVGMMADKSEAARINTRAMANLEKSADRLFNPMHLFFTLQQRGLLIEESLQRVSKSPAFGTGYYMREAGAVTGHNLHIEWLEFSGIVGYVLYVLFVLQHFYRFNGLAAKNEYVAVNLVILLAIIINGVTNGLTNGRLPLLLFIYMGLNEALGQMSQQASSPASSTEFAHKDQG